MKFMILLFLGHFFADWVLQPPKMGKEKSEKLNVLFIHISIIFAVPAVIGFFFLPWYESLGLSLLNALTHAVIDWNIWRGYRVTVKLRNRDKSIEELKANYKYWLDPVFGYFLGFDQIAHVIILYLIYQPFVGG